MKKNLTDTDFFSSGTSQTSGIPSSVPAPDVFNSSVFSVNRTVNGMPVSGNDFLAKYSVEDTDALRLLLAARQRANKAAAGEIAGEGQLIH